LSRLSSCKGIERTKKVASNRGEDKEEDREEEVEKAIDKVVRKGEEC
jgi:hypothetical protein